jgi:uncharacterized protein with FMN-binding domain
MRVSVSHLAYAVDRYPDSALTPFWSLKLGHYLLDLDEPASAAQILGRVVALPDTVAYNPRSLPFADLAELRREARFLWARALARNGNASEAEAQLQAANASNGYELTREAEVRVLRGDTSGALACLRRADRDGHPESNFSNILITMRAVVLAQALAQGQLASQFAAPILQQPQTAQRWPQWQSAWAIIRGTANQAPGLGVAGLRDGEYAGSCRGYSALVGVSVLLRAGRLVGVRVTRQEEERPWSAIEVMPKRLMRQQGLGVDAVTGATITSYAVRTAAGEALAKAAR